MCHVLIIEDEPFIAILIEDILRDSGATTVAIADSESQAIACARSERPAFITSDISLLKGTGPSAVAAIIAEHGSIPVVFLTATPDTVQRQLPSAQVIGKPFTSAQLEDAFRLARCLN